MPETPPAKPPRRPPAHPNRPADPGKRATLKKLAALGLLACVDGAALSSCARKALPLLETERKVIVLGLDGLDARRVQTLMAQGKLPHMSRLQALGGFRPLTSSVPPQSPVAWATFITGRDPGGHGLYDFIQRDPRTYLPYLSIARTKEPHRNLPLGRWRLPLSRRKIELLRKGPAFWDLLAPRGIPCAVYRAPSNYPPRDTGARQLAGLGAPDLRGTYGEYSYFTDAPGKIRQKLTGGDLYPVQVCNGRVDASLIGPYNRLDKAKRRSSVEFTLWVDRGHRVAKLLVQGQQILLRQGEWSEWVPLSFTLIPHLHRVAGICRFYLKQVAPHFELYVTPVNIDPMDPALPISAPADFARQLAQRYGRFYTQGFPQDVKALGPGVLEEDDYLHQAELALGEARRMYEDALDELDRGLLFYYFSDSDRTQHMFWRAIDPKHPTYTAQLARNYGGVIEACYRTADQLVGQALEATDRRTSLIVLSDHGFAPFYRQFHVNAWLKEKGYLVAREVPGSKADIFQRAVWPETAAYAIGLNAVYLNVVGREGQGAVTPEERGPLAHRLAEELRRTRDPDTGQPIIDQVYLSDQSYAAMIPERAPDLIIGYASGYRCAHASILGNLSGPVVSDNSEKWSADHCIDRDAVPGVLLANRPLRAERPSLPDVTASVLAEFPVEMPRGILGKPVW